MGRLKRKEKNKWIVHYSRSHNILLVGEGNFSFSASLATCFCSAANIIATSIDSKRTLFMKYHYKIETTLKELEELGCSVVHGVDVRTMSRHPFLCAHGSFDRIVFNFPHAGFRKKFREEWSKQIERHQYLVWEFLKNAKEMLSENGEIHITHKTNYPYNEWLIVEIAEEEGLYLKEEAEFSIWDYPGYVNKKGSGPNSNRSFPVGASTTFKFVKTLPKIKNKKKKKSLTMSLAAQFTHLGLY